jgi:hypothetical protein
MGCLENEWVGLKIRRASALGGSTPPPGTTSKSLQLLRLRAFLLLRRKRLEASSVEASQRDET